MRNSILSKILSLTMVASMISMILVTPVNASVEYDIPLTTEAQNKIDQFLAEYPQYTDYINDVLSDIKTSVIASDEQQIELHLNEVIEQLTAFKQNNDSEYKVVLEENEKLVDEYNQNNPQKARTSVYDQLLDNYMSGIALVQLKGCSKTAVYMNHAIVPEGSTTSPSTVYETNNSWAEHLIYECYELYDEVFLKFEEEVYPTGNSGTVSGSFEYTQANSSLDAFTALHAVDYVVTFTKRADGNGYNASFVLHDIYDFDWAPYENIFVGFGNTYCWAMQQHGYIKPFEIYITLTE